MTIFFSAIKGLRHGEERPGEAEARLEPRTAPMQRNSCPALLAGLEDNSAKQSRDKRLGTMHRTTGSERLIVKLLVAALILCIFGSGTARADDAGQCSTNDGAYLTGRVIAGPSFARGHALDGVELSHTHLMVLSDHDGQPYDVAIDNVFATGYDAAGENIPAPLSTIHAGDRLELCGKLFTHGRPGDRLGPHKLRRNP